MKALKRKTVPSSLKAAAFALGVFGSFFAVSAPVSAASLSSGLQSAVPFNQAAAREAGVLKVHHFKRHHAKRHHFKRHHAKRHFKRHHFKRHKGHHAKRRHFHHRHLKGKLHGHHRGHSPRHSYASRYGYAGRGGCHEVSKVGHHHGQKALIGGVMCYDSHGRGYVVKGSRYVVRYLHP